MKTLIADPVLLRTVLLIGLLLAAVSSQAADEISFQRDIRPILADRCFTCHGPDESKREAELRLDTREGAFSTRDSRAAFAPGKPELSEALRRMLSADPDEHMPPASSGKDVTPQQIELIRRWLEQGAEWSEHWAFTAPQRPTVPDVKTREAVRTPVDAFIIQRLEREGLALSPEADRVTQLRRLSLDLIGLPPTMDEVDAFLADDSPQAWSRQVERLLQSPHYGERWARLWLDAARYADSDGFEKDKPRFVWAWRDWVIHAINRDLPYDRFLLEQLAGDQLPEATQDQIVATGFLRNSMINEEGGVDPEQFRMEAMFDRMDAIGKAMLGLTIQCCQCHNHKYDPLTQTDYYRLFAFLNNDAEASVPVYTVSELQQRADLFRQMDEVIAGLQERHPDWPQRMAAWEATVRSQPQTEWHVLKPDLDTSGGQKHYLLEDGSILCAGYAPTKHTTEFSDETALTRVTGLRLEMLNDQSLPAGGPGRSIKGLFALSEIRVTAAPLSNPSQVQTVKLVRATADAEAVEQDLDPMFDDRSRNRRTIGPVSFAIDGNDRTAWSTDIGPGRSNVPREAVFVFEKPVEFPDGAVITVKLAQLHGGWNSDDNQNNNLGRFRLSVTGESDPVVTIPPRVRAVLNRSVEQRSIAEVRTVFDHWRTLVPEWKDANDRIEALWKQHPAGSTQLVLQARTAPRMTHLLQRGDFLKPGDRVKPGVPELLHDLPADAGSDRLTLARWMVDRQAPTVARVAVNRVWQTYFGTGLVATSEDFGTQSEPPSHPELLDWLAVEFMEGTHPDGALTTSQPWSLKHLHRLIVNSTMYRQSSRVTSQLLARDPFNRLLARAPRFRVEAEIVRDIALSASGLLVPRIGGPSVYPPAPDFLFQPPASYGPKVWKEETGENRYRRALYTFRFRSVPYPVLQTFDAPNGDASCVRRTRANTPLQALTTLNEPVFVECAQNLALLILREGGSTNTDRLRFAFRRCLSRSPSDEESVALLSLFDRQEQHFSAPDARPWEIAARNPDQPPELPKNATPAQLAAWTVLSRVLLNLDETITRE